MLKLSRLQSFSFNFYEKTELRHVARSLEATPAIPINIIAGSGIHFAGSGSDLYTTFSASSGKQRLAPERFLIQQCLIITAPCTNE